MTVRDLGLPLLSHPNPSCWAAVGVCLLGMGCHGTLPEPEGDGAYLRGRFHNLLGIGIGEVEICSRGEESLCTQSDSEGNFLIEGLPASRDLRVTLDKEGFFPTTLPHFSEDTEPPWEKSLLTTGNMQTVANRVDKTLDPNMGHLSFMVHQQHFREEKVDQTKGVKFRIEPDPGVDLFFLNSFQLPSPDLTETTGAGGGGALNLPPGEYELILEQVGGECSRIISWDFEPGTRVPFPIEAGRSTYFDVLCPQAE